MSTVFTLHAHKFKVNMVHMPANAKAGRPYHHGDLRRSLIAYALMRIRRVGVAEFSIREAARAIEVTPGAAYKHFESKDALIAAAAAEGFRVLASRMNRSTVELSGKEKLLETGRVYIAFASREPRLFRLMFSRIGLQDVGGKAQRDAIPSSFEQLRQALAEVTGKPVAKVDADLLALAWSVAHGAASLISDGVWERDDPRADQALRTFVQVAAERASK